MRPPPGTGYPAGMTRAWAVLALCASFTSAAEPERLAADRRFLDDALWNGRINALYDLGELGNPALPALAYADDDADWQVRLTAVHFLGKLGAPAAAELGAVAGREPCPHVRLSALLWLKRMGGAGERYYAESATLDDAEAIAKLPARYGAELLMGKPLAIDPPDELDTEFFNGGADLRVCASSERAGRLRNHAAPPGRAEPAASEEVVTTPDIPARPPALVEPPPPAPRTAEEERRVAELDRVLTPGPPEALPPGEPGAEPRASASPTARFESPGTRARPSAEVKPAAAGATESFPAGPARPERTARPGTADFAPDAGTGKPEFDAIPILIERLASGDPRGRARAADELGKRGAAARSAVPALRRALKDADRRVRASAALALGSAGAGSTGAAKDLREARRDRDEDVRFSAGIALERLRARPASSRSGR